MWRPNSYPNPTPKNVTFYLMFTLKNVNSNPNTNSGCKDHYFSGLFTGFTE